MTTEKKKKKKEKKKTFLVATNVVASRPPERRPTATRTARAKIFQNATKMRLVIGNAPRKKINTRYSLSNRRAMNVFSFFSD